MRINNIDTEKAGAFIAEAEADPKKAIKEKSVEGEWVFDDGKPQFRASLKHGEASTVVEADGPGFMGGSSSKPDPVQYCLFGLAACYAQTLAAVAAEKGIMLKKLKVSAANRVNLRKALGLGEEPIVESVRLKVSVSGGKDVEELMRLAKERCPGVYCLTNPIKLDIERIE
ncbi:MAG: OsmC family protein [Candidatus Micrarchaeota archaeon]